jgi:hypothetical protein
MDPRTLVTRDLAESGRRLLLRLIGTEVAPLAAMWALRTDRDEQANLFIVSPLIPTRGPIAAYGIVLPLLDELNAELNDPFAEIDSSAVKLLSPSNPLAEGLLDRYHQQPSDRAAFQSRSAFNGVSVEAAYIYPAKMFTAPAQPQSA